MISIIIQGGLGNQLFQIFICIAYGLRYNKHPVFSYSKRDSAKRPHYWETFLKEIKQFTTKNPVIFPVLAEKDFHYTEIPYYDQNFTLNGYFQSCKYFEDKYEDICGLINIESKKEEIKKMVNNDVENMISLHFRIGDYKSIQKYHPLQTDNYYIQAIKTIINKTDKEDWKVLYFCQIEDNNEVIGRIEEYKKIYPKIEFIKASDELCDWQQLLLMSCCKHNIIANSSFSWWGAYFNNNNKKVVCYPKVWFGPAMGEKNMKDLCPEEWIRI